MMPTYKINITLARELSIRAQEQRRSPTKELENILETFFKGSPNKTPPRTAPVAHTNTTQAALSPTEIGAAYIKSLKKDNT